jgi:hypothetical protein
MTHIMTREELAKIVQKYIDPSDDLWWSNEAAGDVVDAVVSQITSAIAESVEELASAKGQEADRLAKNHALYTQSTIERIREQGMRDAVTAIRKWAPS